MRMYLNAFSRYYVGYTPDWLKVAYEDKELTLDIRGEISYNEEHLNCSVKGELIPWVLYDTVTGEEQDLSELTLDEAEAMFPVKKLAKIIEESKEFVIGIYPVKSDNETFRLAEMDNLSECEGTVELYDADEDKYYVTPFSFEVELNL